MTETDRTAAARPRVIERWFPCSEVSDASAKGWGSSNSETLVMSWFAKRPLAQSRAAILCSLLPWPHEQSEQERYKAIIREALGACQDPAWVRGKSDHKYGIADCARAAKDGYDAARADVLGLIHESYPNGARVLDPFSGRGLIPLEAARYGIEAHCIDYSPVATLASRLLVEWPFRNWDSEPDLPLDDYDGSGWVLGGGRLAYDIDMVHRAVGAQAAALADRYYPDGTNGKKPWGYLWAAVMACTECNRLFPMYASNTLSGPSPARRDPGQSFEIDYEAETWMVRVVPGQTDQAPTLRRPPGRQQGKSAWCPYPECGHAHERAEHARRSRDYFDAPVALVVGEVIDGHKVFRPMTNSERTAIDAAVADAAGLPKINGLPWIPDEGIGICNTSKVQATNYGAVSFGDLMVTRQNIATGAYAAAIADLGSRLVDAGVSQDYAQALTGYSAAVLARKIRRSTRGARLEHALGKVGDIFVNESSIGFNYDFFEAGIGEGPGTWASISGTPAAISRLIRTPGRAGTVQRGSALNIPFADDYLDAVVTDPPYGDMIDYADCSDLWFVWLRRALRGLHFDFGFTADSRGGQEKGEEIIVKYDYTSDRSEHRTPAWYRSKIAEAFTEHSRVVADDGVVSIVFGHNDPDVWAELLGAISEAGMVLTGAWPARTEKGGQAGSANINTTLTLACRPAAPHRPEGSHRQVVAEIKALVKERVDTVWTPSQLSYVDQKMAAVGPALEVVGRYARVIDLRNNEMPLTAYLPIARQAVTDAWDMRFDGQPLEVFDLRTQFALEWLRSFQRSVAAASDARWARLAAGIDDDAAGLLVNVKNPSGVRLAYANEWKGQVEADAPFIDVALAAAKAWQAGSLADAAEVMRVAGYDPAEERLWAVIMTLSKELAPTDTDGAVWAEMVVQKKAMIGAVRSAAASVDAAAREAAALAPASLFDLPDGVEEGD
jgi:putative DNA methylase